jgi:hypothetical protein
MQNATARGIIRRDETSNVMKRELLMAWSAAAATGPLVQPTSDGIQGMSFLF